MLQKTHVYNWEREKKSVVFLGYDSAGFAIVDDGWGEHRCHEEELTPLEILTSRREMTAEEILKRKG